MKLSNVKHGMNSAYKKGCRCQVCKDGMARRAREHRARYKEQHGTAYKNKRKSRGYEKVCQNPACRGTFYTPDKRKVVCGDACSYEKRKHARLSRLAPVVYDKAYAEAQRTPREAPTTVLKGTGGVWYVGDCAWCGEGFTRMSWADPITCCSRSCARRLGVKRRGKRSYTVTGRNWISDRRRFAIYERDNYVCQICNVKCSETYSSFDPLSPTLDHIVPKSRWEGSEYVHDDLNLRLACAGCNANRQTTWDKSAWLCLLVQVTALSVKDARGLRRDRAKNVPLTCGYAA